MSAQPNNIFAEMLTRVHAAVEALAAERALPAGLDAQGRLVVHAVDTGLPVQREMQAAEALFAAAAGWDAPHG